METSAKQGKAKTNSFELTIAEMVKELKNSTRAFSIGIYVFFIMLEIRLRAGEDNKKEALAYSSEIL